MTESSQSSLSISEWISQRLIAYKLDSPRLTGQSFRSSLAQTLLRRSAAFNARHRRALQPLSLLDSLLVSHSSNGLPTSSTSNSPMPLICCRSTHGGSSEGRSSSCFSLLQEIHEGPEPISPACYWHYYERKIRKEIGAKYAPPKLENDVLTEDDGSTVQISKCPNGHGKIKSPLCCGADMSCTLG